MQEISYGGAVRPYGTWLVMYEEWLRFFEGIWPMLEDAFHGRAELADADFDERWSVFIQRWEEHHRSLVRAWLDYPVWQQRHAWYHLLAEWNRVVLETRWLLSQLVNRDLYIPEVWPDLQKWAEIFRPWWNHLHTWSSAVDQLHGTVRDTAVWRRWFDIVQAPTTWMQMATAPLYDLQRRARTLGRDWPPEARQGWLRWLQHAIPWTLQWFALWEKWLILPLSGG